MSSNKRFPTLTDEEKSKAASAFARNTFVKKLDLTGSSIGDVFVKALGASLETNKTLEVVVLESNSISGEGLKELFECLKKNTGVQELRLGKQSKPLANVDEDLVADSFERNHTITKLGIDLKSKIAQVKVHRKLSQNINSQLKQKAASKVM